MVYIYYRQCVVFVNHVETNPDIRIVLKYTLLNIGLWSNLMRKTAITTNFYFPAEEKSVWITKNVSKCK